MGSFAIQPNLFVQTNPVKYTLHVVTTMDRINYRAGGHSFSTDENGMLNIELFIDEMNSIPGLMGETPIVHTISFDESIVDDSIGSINFIVYVTDRLGNRSSIGGDTLSTIEEEDVSRPVP